MAKKANEASQQQEGGTNGSEAKIRDAMARVDEARKSAEGDLLDGALQPEKSNEVQAAGLDLKELDPILTIGLSALTKSTLTNIQKKFKWQDAPEPELCDQIGGCLNRIVTKFLEKYGGQWASEQSDLVLLIILVTTYVGPQLAISGLTTTKNASSAGEHGQRQNDAVALAPAA